MSGMRTVVVDKIASVTQACGLSHEVRISPEIPCEEGLVLVVEILNSKANYNTLELTSGRMAKVVRGDETPPPPTSFICDAPSRSCSRTRRRTSSALSAILAAPVCSIKLTGPPGLRGRSDRGRMSPWPPVVVIMAPLG